MAEHFYSVYDWMTDDLRLCGIELTVFALIHSFTETGREYDGSLAYIAQRTGTTRRNAIRMLQKLVDKKLLCKTERFDNGVKYCVYRVPDGLAHPLLTDRHTPKDESSPPPVTDRHTPVDSLSPNHKEDHKEDHKEYHREGKDDAPDRKNAGKTAAPASAPKRSYGEYKNVMLTEEEFSKLKREFPEDWQQRIERLSAYMASTGKRYKNHLATIRSWAMRDEKKKPEESPFAFLTGGLSL